MAPKLNTTGEFYPTYRDANAHYHPDTFTCAEATVSQLLKTVTTADHPGMLLGKVQSGKTRTFISILALAFDNAYDIAIVLSKNSKALIAQTSKDFFKKYNPEARALLNELLEKMPSIATHNSSSQTCSASRHFLTTAPSCKSAQHSAARRNCARR